MSSANYSRFTFKHAWQLAAPHTWPAAIFPVLFAICAASVKGFEISISLAIALLLISVLMQSSVNVFNDYADFKSGADSTDDDVDPSDAVLLYNNVNPKAALVFSVSCIVAAFLIGIYCILAVGFLPLYIAMFGALIVFLYSGGKTPISFLPIGEIVSGFVMGELIAIASWIVLTDTVELLVFIWAIPIMLSISLIMMTNNCCDIEKDLSAGRKTLPVLLGRNKTLNLYKVSIIFMYVVAAVIIAIWFTDGLVVLPFVILLLYPITRAIFANPLLSNTRMQAMGQIVNLNVVFNSLFCACILCSRINLVI